MKKFLAIFATVLVLVSAFSFMILPASAAVSTALTPNTVLVWDDSPARPFTGTSDYSQYYEFSFFDARGRYCIGMSLNYRSSEGFYIDYVYDSDDVGGSQQVYNDGSGRDSDAYWAHYAKYITLITLPTDSTFIAYLQANMSLTQGMTYAEGFNAGLAQGEDIGYARGYQDGLGDADRLTYDEGYHDGYFQGQDDISSGEWGANLIGDTLAAPFKALNQFVLFEYDNIYGLDIEITLGHIVGSVIAFSIFIAFLKLFAGG